MGLSFGSQEQESFLGSKATLAEQRGKMMRSDLQSFPYSESLVILAPRKD